MEIDTVSVHEGAPKKIQTVRLVEYNGFGAKSSRLGKLIIIFLTR